MVLLRLRLQPGQWPRHLCHRLRDTNRSCLFQSRKYSRYPEEGVFQSRPTNATTPKLPPSPLEQPPAPHPRSNNWKEWLPRWYNVLGGTILAGIGYLYVSTMPILRVPMPLMTSDDEASNRAELKASFDNLPIVKQLREDWRLVDGEKKPLWREWPAYQGISVENSREQRLTTGPLGSSSGLANQNIFWNESMQELIVFINFGDFVSDAPGIVHRGAVATICDEALGRLAIKLTEKKTAVTAYLEIKFAEAIECREWYALVVKIDPTMTSTDSKKYVYGIMARCTEDFPQRESFELLDFQPSVLASGLFIVPKNIKLASISDDF